ncbi:MAG: HlyC/CorC family transporter [Candidatus Aenigmarchaeota archaeon]|nr:HlyC/CorC family transporter [Candidatus Aenigmarchaeota archaeon]
MIWLVLVLVLLIALSAFFSGAEIALFSLSDIKVKKISKRKGRRAKALLRLKSDPHRLLVTILIGNNLVNILAASIATILFTDIFGSNGIGIATGILTFIILIFGEITPKTYFHRNAEKMSLRVARPVLYLSIVIYPVIVLIELISNLVLRTLGVGKNKDSMTEEELHAALSLGAKAGVIERDEEEMIHNIFEFGDTTVGEVMTPRKRVVALPSDMTLGDAIGKMLEVKYSRIPVYKKSFDNVIGMLNIRQILKYIKRKNFDMRIEGIVSRVLFVYEKKNIDLLMDDFRESGTHMAIVIDRNRKVKGIVTLEDLLEEIVGEIYDEPDVKRHQMRFIDRKTAIVNGDTLVEELKGKIGVPLRSNGLTLSEMVSARFDGRPSKGSKIKMKNFTLTVMSLDDSDPSKIKRIKVIKRRGKIRK